LGLRISKLVLDKNIHVCNIVQRFIPHIYIRKRPWISAYISIYIDVDIDMAGIKKSATLAINYP
jgi:hypothetical protein